MEINDYAEKLKEIEKAVAGLQEPLKSKAIDKLLEQTFNTNKADKPKTLQSPRTKKVQAKRSATINEDSEADKKMIESINRTEYPEIHKLQTSLDKALFVLDIMKDKGYDGLNPSQIKTILSDIFRIKANTPAISMALINDKHYTEKEAVSYKGSKANKYRIMKSGEDYIKSKISNTNNHTGSVAEEPSQDLSREDTSDSSELAN